MIDPGEAVKAYYYSTIARLIPVFDLASGATPVVSPRRVYTDFITFDMLDLDTFAGMNEIPILAPVLVRSVNAPSGIPVSQMTARGLR